MKKEIGYLKSLKRAYAWKILEEELMWRVKELENEIFNDFTPENNNKVYSKNDIKKVERLLLKQFIDLPETLISAMDIIEVDEQEE